MAPVLREVGDGRGREANGHHRNPRKGGGGGGGGIGIMGTLKVVGFAQMGGVRVKGPSGFKSKGTLSKCAFFRSMTKSV